MVPPIPTRAYHHKTRAEDFFCALRLLADDVTSYGNAVALLAVHCAISMADAVCLLKTSSHSGSENHEEAVIAFRKSKGKQTNS